MITIAQSKVKTLVSNIVITGAASSGGLIALTASGHGLESNDIVNASAIGGVPAATGQWTVTVLSSSVFTLNNSVFGGTYTSGGLAVHVGFSASAITDNVAIGNPAPDSTTLKVQLSSLSPAASVRFAVFDAYDAGFTSEEPIASFNAAGSTNPSADEMWNLRLPQTPDWRIGNSGDVVRIKALISGGPGTSATFSAWIEGV
jgi:hypothetical protein